jgi:hypothetical protein
MIKLFVGLVTVVASSIKYSGGVRPDMSISEAVCTIICILGVCKMAAGFDDLYNEGK